MIEAGIPFRDFSLDNPIRAIREVGDLTGGARCGWRVDSRPVPWTSSGVCCRAPEYLQSREPNAQLEQVVDLWGRQLDAVESQDYAKVDTEIDWVIKRKLFQRATRTATTWSWRRSQDQRNWIWPITTSSATAVCSTCCSAGPRGAGHHR